MTNEQRKKLRKLPIFEKGRNEGGLIDNEEVSVRKKLRGFASRTIGRYSESDENITAIELKGHFMMYLPVNPEADCTETGYRMEENWEI